MAFSQIIFLALTILCCIVILDAAAVDSTVAPTTNNHENSMPMIIRLGINIFSHIIGVFRERFMEMLANGSLMRLFGIFMQLVTNPSPEALERLGLEIISNFVDLKNLKIETQP
ncbi:hypothetical protein C0J52_26378 [Blattella germanica]|nr:hypothetical protein C0J52_26378 [Blattella germanica]